MSELKYLALLVVFGLSLSSCGDERGETAPSANTEQALQQELSAYVRKDLFPDIESITRQRDPALEQLGMELFFSKSLSGNFDVACASCHHPLLAGGDGLSLPVGEAAYNPDLLGPGRWHDWRASKDHKAEGGPNVARHSPTTFNSGLYQQALFADGRVFINSRGNDNQPGPEFRSPDSRFAQADANAGNSLLATQTRFPVTSREEMRGFTFAAGEANEAVRSEIVQRLLRQGAAPGHNPWLTRFRDGFNRPAAPAAELINFDNIQTALAAYQRSQLLIDNDWYRYLNGATEALSEKQKTGALLFFRSTRQGGANCAACHQPPTFTDEKYHNIAMLQFGRGKRANHEDFGRRGVTQREQDRYGFRTPSLLNVELTAPYGHTGAYLDLASVIAHHLDPEAAIRNFDYSFSENPQLKYIAHGYANARQLTRPALSQLKLAQRQGISLLPAGLQLTDDQVSAIVAFLAALTDPCMASAKCLQQWIPGSSTPAPDPHRLTAEFSDTRASIAPPYNLKPIQTTARGAADIAPRVGRLAPELDAGCARRHALVEPLEEPESMPPAFRFDDVTRASGISASHSIAAKIYNITNMQRLSFSGGAAAGDIDGDCFNDIYYVTGAESSDALYINNADGSFTNRAEAWNITRKELSNGASLVDIDGDGDLDIFTSNIAHPSLAAITRNTAGDERLTTTTYKNEHQKTLSLWPEMSIEATVASWSFAFADYDADGDLDILSSHWQLSPPNTQHLWRNENGLGLTAIDDLAGLTHIYGSRDVTWTGLFADVTGDGYPDILMTADFEDSQVFINQANNRFANQTGDSQITDENGMGAAVIDVDNDGDLDWFVSSIWDPRASPPADRNWGLSGNRLYRNDGGIFADISQQAGVRQGYWGWGSCFADFNNDGWPDLFHANGFGVPADVKRHLLGNRDNRETRAAGNVNSGEVPIVSEQLFTNIAPFNNTGSRLYISNQDGTFTEQAAAWGITDKEQGRAVICFDYDRDGDLDIFVSNNQGAPILYNNNARRFTATNFINIRLRGRSRNSQAIGAKVYVTANEVTQLQEVRAGGSFISGGPAELHFGLADATTIEHIDIVWPRPDYIKHRLESIASNQFITLVQPDE